jgi:hypothetical protein
MASGTTVRKPSPFRAHQLPATTEESEEAGLIHAIRTLTSRVAVLPLPSPEAERCRAELRRFRGKLEALYRRWPGRRGCFTLAPSGRSES